MFDEKSVTERSDILLLFTDMQRADTIHALGNESIRTPHLDRLVREGRAFINCHTPSPVCVPARCSMHYGLYPQRTGVFDNQSMMADNGNSLPAVLGRNGYATHAIGKCHFTPDRQALRGFDSRQTQEECTSDPDDDDYVAWLAANGYDYYEPNGARGEMYYIPQVSCLPAEAHPTQWVGNETARFIREKAEGEKPWFLFSSFIHPHPPFAPPKPWHRLYRADQMPLPFVPDRSEELHTWVNRAQNRYKWRDRGIDQNLIRTIKAYCYATISFVDYPGWPHPGGARGDGKTGQHADPLRLRSRRVSVRPRQGSVGKREPRRERCFRDSAGRDEEAAARLPAER